MAYSGKEASPFFVVHGDHDRLVPVEDAQLFADHLRHSSSNPVVYVELPSAEHHFDLFHSIRTEAVVHGIEEFTAWVRDNNKHN